MDATLFNIEPPDGPRAKMPPHNGTDASIDGARRAASVEGEQCQRVLQAIRNAGPQGWTNAELAFWLGLPINVICARTNNLAAAKLIQHLPERRSSVIGVLVSVIRHQAWVALYQG
jgi:hypothetical protein